MTILGIDYGRAKIGLALAEGGLAEPWKVVKVSSTEDATEEVVQVVQVEHVDRVVVGVSEGKMGEEQKKFAQALGLRVGVPIEIWDETLSTQEAQSRSIAAGVSKKRRRRFEDAFAATVMLQSYLDQHGSTTKDS